MTETKYKLRKQWVFDPDANNNIYKLEFLEANGTPDIYEHETDFSNIDFWRCGGCYNLFTYNPNDKYIVVTDYSSFEPDISWYVCYKNCNGEGW